MHRQGDLRDLVLPGGGDLCLRVWSGIRRFTFAIAGWLKHLRVNHSAYMYHVGLLRVFLDNETQHSQHAWAMLDAKESLRTHCEIHFFLDEADPPEGIVNKLAKEPGAGGKEEGGDLIQILNGIVEKATCRGKEKMEAQRTKKNLRFAC